MFGEMEVIENELRHDFCKCESDCLILLIDKDRFLKEMEKEDILKIEIKEIIKNKKKLIEQAKSKILM